MSQSPCRRSDHQQSPRYSAKAFTQSSLSCHRLVPGVSLPYLTPLSSLQMGDVRGVRPADAVAKELEP